VARQKPSADGWHGWHVRVGRCQTIELIRGEGRSSSRRPRSRPSSSKSGCLTGSRYPTLVAGTASASGDRRAAGPDRPRRALRPVDDERNYWRRALSASRLARRAKQWLAWREVQPGTLAVVRRLGDGGLQELHACRPRTGFIPGRIIPLRPDCITRWGAHSPSFFSARSSARPGSCSRRPDPSPSAAAARR
jgi:hypothetical protein